MNDFRDSKDDFVGSIILLDSRTNIVIDSLIYSDHEQEEVALFQPQKWNSRFVLLQGARLVNILEEAQ